MEADDLTPSTRQRINLRIRELEEAIAERNGRCRGLLQEPATEPSSLTDVAPLLDRLAVLADKLADMPHMELRALFDRLQLDIAYHPGDSALDVSLTLYGEGAASFGDKASEDWSVPPVGASADLSPGIRLNGRMAVAT